MKILEFLFLLGVGFAVFEFIWGIFKIVFNLLTSSLAGPAKTNAVRIAKYITFVAVIIQYIETINLNNALVQNDIIGIVLGTIVMALYLLGKYQNRAVFAQMRGVAGQLGLGSAFDPKLEKILILGASATFVIGSLYPQVFNNTITTWFTTAIMNIHNTFFFGFIFSVIAIFLLINTFGRGSRILGKLLSGESFSDATKSENKTFQYFNNQNFNRRSFNRPPEEPEYTELRRCYRRIRITPCFCLRIKLNHLSWCYTNGIPVIIHHRCSPLRTWAINRTVIWVHGAYSS